jgi:hypothetical protein
MSQAFLNDERCVDLLIQEVTSSLTEAESAELAQLLARYPGADRSAFEPAAAALALAARLPLEPLPGALRARLLAQAGGASGATAPVVDFEQLRRARELAGMPAAPARPRSGTAGWWAAAAALLVAIAGWYPRLQGPPHARSAAELRAQLLAAHPEAVRWEFAATGDPGGVGASGDVVFDPATQQGYMRFRKLRPNDPKQYEYQLWIFDGERDDRYPVDGGVFDIPAGRTEVVVPITARVRVGKPALFAVTVERPGGVVVSAREHIVVLAKPKHA